MQRSGISGATSPAAKQSNVIEIGAIMGNRKRGQGEGNIYKRADGRWAARISAGYRNGKRARRWVYGKTRAAAAKQLRATIQAHEQGSLVAPGRVTVEQFLTRWLEDCAKPKLRPSTVASYAQIIRLHVVPGLGPVPLQRLNPPLVQSWLNERQKAGLSPRTCQYARAILRSALGQALRWGIVSRNVVTLVESPRVTKHEIRPLQPDQARALLDAVRLHRLGALFTVALALGLRQGEALGLKWDAVDFQAGTLQVRAALQRVGKKWILVEPKSERSRRVVALPRMAIVALRAHRVRQKKERLLAGPRWNETGFVFATRTGTPLAPRNLNRAFKGLLKRANLPDVRFHDLRHTAATFLLAQGVDARTIMETLGHSQISLTMNTYSHVLPTLQRDAADRMNRLLVG
jgi:integrase